MSPTIAAFLAVTYGYVYYVMARGLIGRIMDVDPEYAGRWTRPTWHARAGNSFAILQILMTMSLPKPAYPTPLKWRLWIARIMLWLWPFVLLAVLVLPGAGTR